MSGPLAPIDAMRRGAARAVLVVMVAALAGPMRAQAARDAEYALRWDPAAGGPATIEAVLLALHLEPGKARQMEVQYFAVPQPAGLPEGFAAARRTARSSARRSPQEALAAVQRARRARAPLLAGSIIASWPGRLLHSSIT